jgi:LysM repeat protein
MHTVAPGDTLWDISQKYGVTLSDIEKWNNKNSDWKGADLLIPGMKLSVSPKDK